MNIKSKIKKTFEAAEDGDSFVAGVMRALTRKGYGRRRASRMIVQSLTEHPLRRKHFGTFSPVKHFTT